MTPLQQNGLVLDAFPEGPFRRIRLHAPALAARLQPGQFVTADLGAAVREPLLPAAVGAEGLEMLLPPGHPAAALAPGDAVDLLGPLGRALPRPQPPQRLLLIADVPHLPALLPFAHQSLANGCPAALLLSAATAAHFYPPALLPPALEVHLVTADGSAGHAGSPLDLLPGRGQAPPLLAWADRVLVAADPVLYMALAEVVLDTRLMPGPDFAQALLLPTIVCGVGACQGCAVRTRRGTRRACTDGPFFSLLDLEAQ